ncbi:hypothetical protein [Nocardioides pantholopis]|uniref:hypothetical protein n=1 Tax=Nocardioides pantholopis TaxID=2483798 RepID=UPI001F14A99B|nr:hypothetical protein [Nocardioides pantholopis]
MTTTPRRRMRSASVAIGITALAASGLTGCASSADYAAVCVDPETQERVEDKECDDDSEYNGSSVGSGFFWYYLGASSRVPAVGGLASGGTWRGSGLNGTVQRGGLPTTGGSSVKSTTTKGGFGGSSRGFSS